MSLWERCPLSIQSFLGRSSTLNPHEVERFLSVVGELPKLTERRLQRLQPTQKDVYKSGIDRFLDLFLAMHDIEQQVMDWDGIYIFGEARWHLHILQELKSERDWIEKVSGIKVRNIILFAGLGSIMNGIYRQIGSYFKKPGMEEYPLAIAGCRSCFFNISDDMSFYNASLRASRKHEFRHTAIAMVLQKITGDIYLTDKNKVIHEACGGPGEAEWRRRGIERIRADVELLDKTHLFWSWLDQQQKKYGCDQPFFDNPIVKSFYLDYVFAKGDDEFWFKQALALANR